MQDQNTMQGLQNAKTQSTIAATALASTGTNVPAVNFAYSMWIYINDWNYRYGEKKVILGRVGSLSAAGIINPDDSLDDLEPCPVISLGATDNTLSVALSCYPNTSTVNDLLDASSNGLSPTSPSLQICSIPNVPIQKWVNIVASVYGNTLDIYLDGKLAKTCVLPGVVKVNGNSSVYITPAGGFDGWTAKMQYYPRPLNPQEVWNIYSAGYGNWWSMFNTYSVQVELVQNGNVKTSTTI